MWMFPVALACGSTFLLRPCENDPSLAIEMARLLQKARLPDGVFNVVNGHKVAVDALLDNLAIEALSFVGSRGRRVHLRRNMTARLKPLGLEWVDFQVMRRTRASLSRRAGIDPKVWPISWATALGSVSMSTRGLIWSKELWQSQSLKLK
jgi:hypothetical protein